MFQYDGKRKKSANAMVEGYLNRYYVYISDYLVENISVDEVRAIILHEIGHIKKHHILVRNIIIMGLMPLLYFVGLIMDNINKFFQVEINLILGCVIMLSIVIGYSVFMYLFICRIQEYQADAFAVHQGVKAKLLCDALVRLAELNDTVKNISKVEQSLSTHPTIEKRVNKLLGIKEG